MAAATTNGTPASGPGARREPRFSAAFASATYAAASSFRSAAVLKSRVSAAENFMLASYRATSASWMGAAGDGPWEPAVALDGASPAATLRAMAAAPHSVMGNTDMVPGTWAGGEGGGGMGASRRVDTVRGPPNSPRCQQQTTQHGQLMDKWQARGVA
jgi:hypothetical protein